MSASQRRKGQVGEREAHKALWEQLGDVVQKRDLSQTRDGGGDIRIPAAKLVVEVKRTQLRAVPTWLSQAWLSAREQGPDWLGVVLWRRNGGEWRAFLPPARPRDNGLSLTEFCDWVRGELRHG